MKTNDMHSKYNLEEFLKRKMEGFEPLFIKEIEEELDRNLMTTASKMVENKSEQLALVDEFKDEIEGLKRSIDRIMEDDLSRIIYFEYRRLGGIFNEIEFRHHLKRFYQLTFNIYVNGSCINIDGTYCDSRQSAFTEWVLYLREYSEAELYMKAVDNISSYS